MNKKYIINVNGGVFNKGGKNVFDEKELIEVFEEWSGGKKMVIFDESDEDYDNEELVSIFEGKDISKKVDVKDLIECGDVMRICNREMCERGDDYVEVSVVELEG